MKKKKKKILILTPLAIIIITLVAFFCYTGNYYHASDVAKGCMESVNNVKVIVGDSNEIAFIPDNIEAGVIFYPGGLVEYEAYAPLMMKLAQNDIMAVIVKMPFKLAMFNENGAENVLKAYPYVDEWYISGHSLGGVFATRYASKHVDDFKGVLLLASYTTEDISESDLNVLCMYGTQDKVLNIKNYEKAKANLPTDYKEVIIDGGCHAFFGSYGPQKGDGDPTITVETQTELTAKEICDFIK